MKDLVGRLAERPLAEILQSLGRGRRTGKLTLSRPEGIGVILFRQGDVIHATSDAVREALGHILVSKGLITEAALLEALETQQRSPGNPLLGAVLVRQGSIGQESLEACIRQQIERVLDDLLAWNLGFYKFEPMDYYAVGDGAQVNLREFLLRVGVAPQDLIRDPPPPAPEEAPRATAPTGLASPLVELRAVLQEIRAPSITGEITGKILGYAARRVGRGVFFVMKAAGISGLSQFGLGNGPAPAEERARRILLPSSEPSVLAGVLETGRSYLGPPGGQRWDRRLMEALGGRCPDAVVAVPMIVRETVVAILYGDNATDGRPITDLEGLELLMSYAGLAMEKAILERQLRGYQGRLPPADG